MATDTDLPFDPSEPLSAADRASLSDEERVAVAAHAHYVQVRQALDTIAVSADQASVTPGITDELIQAVEEHAYADQEAEEEAALDVAETTGIGPRNVGSEPG